MTSSMPLIRQNVLQEIIPDPTPESIARDAEVEAQVFAQAGNVDRLLAMLSAADAQGSSISDDDDLMVGGVTACAGSHALTHIAFTGAVPPVYPNETKDCQASRQVQSETKRSFWFA
jgi:hypothetical protein